jgi:hypothetical protein
MGKRFYNVLACVCVLTLAAHSQAAIYDQPVTNAVIYGSGNVNSPSFAVDRQGDLELGLRAHTRFVDDAASKSNGAGLYTSFSTTPSAPGLGSWNFDFSINTNTQGMGVNVGDLSLRYFKFDPINGAPYFDHSFGTNATLDSAGTEAPSNDAITYASLKANNNLVQNSWNLGFFPGFPAYDPSASGLYDVVLSAFDVASGAQLGSVGIQVEVGDGAQVPEATSFIAWGLLALTFGGLSRRWVRLG